MLAASQEPPLPLKDRLRLSNLTIWFRFDDLTTLRKATGIDVATRNALISFITQQFTEISPAKPVHWRLLREDGTEADLGSWSPQSADGRTFHVKNETLSCQSKLLLRSGFGNAAGRTHNLYGAYQVISDHLLIVILKTHLTLSKTRKTVKDSAITTLDMLVPHNLTLGTLLQATDATWGSMQEDSDPLMKHPTTHFDVKDQREIGILGWRHGHRLRVWDNL